MNEYQPNSHKHKEELKKQNSPDEKRASKVVTGVVKTKKKSEVRKLADTFISDDVSKVKEFVWLDVLVPAVKKAISDIITNGIDMILYGESGRSKKSSLPGSKIGYVPTNYSSISSNQRGFKPVANRSTYSYDDITLTTRGEAENVIMAMDEIVSEYKFVRVADLYDLVGVTGSHTDCNYGWTDIRSAEVVRTRDGYMIKLPRALPID